MTDTTTEAMERLANNVYAAPMTYCADARDTLRALTARVAELEASLKRWETAAAKGAIYTRKDHEDAVAAALEEAINRVNGCDRVSEVQPAIRALIAQYEGKTDDP